jgi:hypothetical protein
MNRSQTACPFPRTLFIPEKRLERVCAEALESVGLMPSDAEPIRIDRFVEKFFEVDIAYDDLSSRFEEGVMGACRFNRGGEVAEILIDRSLGDDDSKLGLRRERSTLAHEAGHGLFHGELFAEKLRADEEIKANGLIDTEFQNGVFSEGFACRGLGDPIASRKDWWEVQANMAMAALLLPRQLVDPFLRDYVKPIKLSYGSTFTPDLEDACGGIADAFNVSVTMARFRIEKEFERLQNQPDLF